jgi:hypothetical protein
MREPTDPPKFSINEPLKPISTIHGSEPVEVLAIYWNDRTMAYYYLVDNSQSSAGATHSRLKCDVAIKMIEVDPNIIDDKRYQVFHEANLERAGNGTISHAEHKIREEIWVKK